MQQLPIRNDPPHHAFSNPTNKFARIDNNSTGRTGQYYSPLVYGNKLNAIQEFGKSPLTSVQIHRKNKTRSIPVNEQIESHIEQKIMVSNTQFWQGCDWKQILFWVLVSLAILALAIGLFFLIRGLSGKKNPNKLYFSKDISESQLSTEINPIYVNPIPYSSMETEISSWIQSSDKSNQVASPTEQTQIQLKSNLIKMQKTQSTPPNAILVNPVTQPTQSRSQSPNYSPTYVAPLNVYSYNHK